MVTAKFFRVKEISATTKMNFQEVRQTYSLSIDLRILVAPTIQRMEMAKTSVNQVNMVMRVVKVM